MTERMWSIDIEGSGTSPPEIVELAIVEMHGLDLTGRSKHWYVRPRAAISPLATRVHGIRESDVADAPTIGEICDDLHGWLQGFPIVGHNVSVDYTLLTRELSGWQPRVAIDTLWLARHLLPNEESYGLARLGAVLDLNVVVAKNTGGVAHSALYDASLSAQLLKYMLTPLSDRERRAMMLDADILQGRQRSLF